MKPLKALIVEDEALLALELSDVLADNGIESLGPAADRAAALRLADETHPDLALVDVHLSDGPTGIDVARHLSDLAIPTVFVTANLKRLPDDLCGAIGVIEKPYTSAGIDNAVAYLARFVTTGTAGVPPPGLTLAAPDRPRAHTPPAPTDQPRPR